VTIEHKKMNTKQEIYYFSHDDVLEALSDKVFSNENIKPSFAVGLKPRITAGLSPGSGLTLTFEIRENVK
jgi:hypothetical protein